MQSGKTQAHELGGHAAKDENISNNTLPAHKYTLPDQNTWSVAVLIQK